jgi:dTDP-4-dehydrorhamnose 3,5-epimerase
MSFCIESLRIPEVVLVTPARICDTRGYFAEVFRDDSFRSKVSDLSFVQENESLSLAAGTVRGLHFQTEPFAQGKLVRCLAGGLFDVAVDIRAGSPTYGEWVAATLTAEQGNQLWIPAGFLHGFCTLASNTLVAYKVSNYYSPDCDKGVRWNDPDIGVAWPDVVDPSQLSPKDARQPRLSELPHFFTYDKADS